MTQHQLEELDDTELALLFYIVNKVFPMTCPTMEFDMNSIKWHRHDMLIKKILEAFPRLKPEGHPVYSSLLAKLGTYIEIKYEQPPTAPPTGSSESSPEILPTLTEVTASVVDAPQTGSSL